MQITVLDGYALNPGDLDWQSLRELGNLTVYDRTPEPEVLARAADAEILLTNKAIISAATIRQLPKLKYIGVMATGYNVVDVAAAKERGIVVTNVPAYGTASVAQFTFALILELCCQVGVHNDSVHEGDWARSPDFSYWKVPLTELEGKVLGIVGLGSIGRQVARIALAFGMKVMAHHKHPERDRMEGVTFVELDTCFTEADIVSLHCPLNAENREFVNRALLSRMKRSAFLVNTSRGPLIQEADLAAVLREGIIAGAALDVLSVEPPSGNNPLLTAPRCIITPHIAWASRDARGRLFNTAVQNVRSFLGGHPENVLNQ